ncbi:hypothetical protein GCK72_005025 [Caenorhabditis remanei]|uniref:Uncharacterized protein n=1 Tax=Caenorhabditis remanei TaxID=31234 RepID=A0A6A5HE09_CAERE|nr:hypothetical protein GCK72_005025 [Caenorhabditis remanei]KAF1765074.1 hypothetical protein GCK72_005025 [Caenorhabditis remanei]
MAIISSQNRTCASETLLESYRSPIYTLQIIFNCLIPIASMFFLGKATYQLCTQSIIQYSTRVLLITTIMFAACHQAAYFSFKIDLLHTMLFKLSDPCFLQRSSYDCRFISFASTAGNCGMTLTQLAMSIDRALALTFPKSYYKLKALPGYIMASVVIVLSFSIWFLLTINDPLTGYLNHCGFYPSYSTANFESMLDATMVIATLNLFFDCGLMYYARQQIRWKRSYQFLNRFESRISLNCTQAVFVISVCECLSFAVSSGLMKLLMFVGNYISTVTYSTLLSLFYTSPYSCLLLPILISKVLVYIKNQRTIGILSLRNEKQDLEEHHKRMKMAWK